MSAAWTVPTSFPISARARLVVIGCTFDPLGLQGPLTVWLDHLTGLRSEIQWLPYGMVTESIGDLQSGGAWNKGESDLNVLFLRFRDLLRDGDTLKPLARGARHPAWDLVEALRRSCKARRRGAATVVVLTPAPVPLSS